MGRVEKHSDHCFTPQVPKVSTDAEALQDLLMSEEKDWANDWQRYDKYPPVRAYLKACNFARVNFAEDEYFRCVRARVRACVRARVRARFVCGPCCVRVCSQRCQCRKCCQIQSQHLNGSLRFHCQTTI